MQSAGNCIAPARPSPHFSTKLRDPMKQRIKLTQSEQQQELATHQEQTRDVSARDSGTVEEMLRYDAEQTTVPPAIATRLEESIASTPEPSRSWWRRWLGI